MIDRLNSRISGSALPLTVVIGFPVVLVGAWLLSEGTVPAEAVVFLIGVYATGLLWVRMSSDHRTLGDATLSTDTSIGETAVAAISNPGLQPRYFLTAPSSRRVVSVIGSVGVCPRGFVVANRIYVDNDGRLSRPICQTATAALNPLVNSGDGLKNVSCACPIAGRSLTFEVADVEDAIALA